MGYEKGLCVAGSHYRTIAYHKLESSAFEYRNLNYRTCTVNSFSLRHGHPFVEASHLAGLGAS